MNNILNKKELRKKYYQSALNNLTLELKRDFFCNGDKPKIFEFKEDEENFLNFEWKK